MVVASSLARPGGLSSEKSVVHQGAVALMLGVMAAHDAVWPRRHGKGVEADPQAGAGEEAGEQAYHLALAVDHHIVALAANAQQQILHVAPLVAARLLDDDQSIDVGVSLCHARAVIHDQIVNFPAVVVLLGGCCTVW